MSDPIARGRRTSSYSISRVYDSDKEAEYVEATSADDRATAELEAAIRSCEAGMEVAKAKLKTKTATREDVAKLKELEKKRDEIMMTKTRTEIARRAKLSAKIETTEEQIERKKKIRQVFKFIRDSEKVDLCFLVDCTGSMILIISEIENKINTIVTKLSATMKNANIRLSFVGYRDISDGSNEFSILPFTKEISEFSDFMETVQATGGGDTCEDIAGAVKAVNELEWTQGTRVAIHFADAPCHGSQYHETSVDDDYPSGTPGINLPDQLANLRNTFQVQYFFSHIKKHHTEKMIRVLNEEMKSNYISEIELSDKDNLANLVVSTVTQAVGKTFTISESKLGEGKSEFEIDPEAPMSWTGIPTRTATVTRCSPYSSMDDIKNSTLRLDVLDSARVQIASTVMGEGRVRYARHGTLKFTTSSKTEKMIFKQLKEESKSEDMKNKLLGSVEESAVAAWLANEFNNSSARPGSKTVEVLQSALVETSDKKLYTVEQALPEGAFVKFVDNSGHVFEEFLDSRDGPATLPCFMKFTRDLSDGWLMVADLQGVETADKYILTDPVILCEDGSRFTSTNLGKDMIKKFDDVLEQYT
eukprot:TRINITY_DN8392_c1_g1_i1.p1 TRINITY_DN8392_c1_g1~~TRINITY_DN8392_c1_g1_i1.p1  ORF type:complete len:589 (+),score=172.14 TRINITY_DN8392_c1_g1_i1:66-1832(+)